MGAVIPFERRLDPTERPPNPGNGAREAILAWLNSPPVASPAEETFFAVSADALLAYLYVEGFKVVPLEDKDWRA